ncbi:MAG: hypothetical protein ACLFTA_02140 [Candidatus Nanohaloarchaea archaeon]
MSVFEDTYSQVREEASELYRKTDPVKASICIGSVGAALYALNDPSAAEWVDNAGHMATGTFGSSLADLAYDHLEPDDKIEKTRKPAMILSGLATGNAGQAAQGLDLVSGGYDLRSVGEAGVAATANALGTEKYPEELESRNI